MVPEPDTSFSLTLALVLHERCLFLFYSRVPGPRRPFLSQPVSSAMAPAPQALMVPLLMLGIQDSVSP